MRRDLKDERPKTQDSRQKAGWDNLRSKMLRFIRAEGTLIGHGKGRKKEGYMVVRAITSQP